MLEHGTPAIPTPSGTGTFRLMTTLSCCPAAQDSGGHDTEEANAEYAPVDGSVRLGPRRRWDRASTWSPERSGTSGDAKQRLGESARHRLRNVRLSVSLLPAIRGGDLPPTGTGLHQIRKGALGVHQLSAHQRSSACICRGSTRHVRRQPREFLESSRSAVQI